MDPYVNFNMSVTFIVSAIEVTNRNLKNFMMPSVISQSKNSRAANVVVIEES